MFNGMRVIDIHGHHSTPANFRAYAYNLIALRSPRGSKLEISDEAMGPALERHLRVLDERNIDMQFISPRPVAMMHWEQPLLVDHWSQTTNDVIAQTVRLHPDRFRGVAQLPQVGIDYADDTSNCIAELERAINELGFVAATVNPDPGGDRRAPGMNEAYWFPLYERAEALSATLIIHASISRDPRVQLLPHSYQYNFMTEQTLATDLLQQSDVFERYPKLRIQVCHCGGSVSRFIPNAKPSGEAGGGSVGIGARTEAAHADEGIDLSNNLYFDTCSYDKDYLAVASKQRGVDQMIFGSESPGSGTAVLNPDTGRPSDDMIPVIDSIDFLTDADKKNVFRETALKAFPLYKE